MSSMLMAFVTTVVVLVALLIWLRLAGSRAPHMAGWFSFVAGVAAFLAVATTLVDTARVWEGVDRIGGTAPWLPLATMTLGLVGLATGVFGLIRQEYSWRVWTGLMTGALVILYWVMFAFGELLTGR